MNEEKLKQLISADIEAAAPDKEELWAKIEQNLKPKTPAEITTPRKRSRSVSIMRYAGLAAACAAVIMLVPVGLNLVKEDSFTNGITAADNAASPEQENTPAEAPANDGACLDEAPDAFLDKPETQPLAYSELAFSSYSETLLKCSGNPYGGSYFVEESILSEADCIVRAEVTRVTLSEDGESLCYQLSVSESYTLSADLPETLEITSRSQYPMRRGREYLLPLTKGEEGWHTAFDGVPQIEYTADGGLVYYNGWSTLTTDLAQHLLYPQTEPDEFFYDRMMYLESGDISKLIADWYEIKAV